MMRQWLKQPQDTPVDAQAQLATAIAPHLDQCLACLGCQTACPSGVPYEALLLETREAIAPFREQTVFGKIGRWIRRALFRYLLPNKFLLRLMAMSLHLAQLLGVLALSKTIVRGLQRISPGLPGLSRLAPWILLATEPQPFQDYPRALTTPAPQSGKQVGVFVGCVMDVLQNPVHHATVRVLKALLEPNGHSVSIPPQTCCGALAYHNSDSDIAKPLAQENARHWAELDTLVVNSGGCGSTLQAYHHLLEGTPEATTRLPRVVDVMVLVHEVMQQRAAEGNPVELRLPEPLTVTYHAACHLYHAQGITAEPLAVLSQIENLTLVPLTDASLCCGSAGVYNLVQPELANEILDLKLAAIAQTGAQGVVTGNPGCHMQLEMGLQGANAPQWVKHPIELVAMALPGRCQS